jgi:predicted unusual protein kinase regulating ubiquinone biosynthesis (AarF/ABC1/UbiB family)
MMDAIGAHLAPQMGSRVTVPRSVPGLVTRRALVMGHVRGFPLKQLEERARHMSQRRREQVGRVWGLLGGFRPMVLVLVFGVVQALATSWQGLPDYSYASTSKRPHNPPKASRRVLSTLSEAYGRMILEPGLFQADAHAGNAAVAGRRGGAVALLDFGQSKQLGEGERVGLTRLVLALARWD